jgi:hypothetical protein
MSKDFAQAATDTAITIAVHILRFSIVRVLLSRQARRKLVIAG